MEPKTGRKQRRPWLVLREHRLPRWGGELRRRHIFAELARQTAAVDEPGWSAEAVRRGLRAAGRRTWPRRAPIRVASVELLRPNALQWLRPPAADAAVLDVHDEPAAQLRALGVPADAERVRELDRLFNTNVETFAMYCAPTRSFAALARLDPSRTIIAPNGTDTSHIRPAPFPVVPAVGLASGAAPGRGIETLIEACRAVRRSVDELRLFLWLIATGHQSLAYLEELQRTLVADRWITIGTVEYGTLGAALGRATVLCVPHPRGEYWDAALPVKLLDSMAAGRPLVVTPCPEMRTVVEGSNAGVVADGDTAVDLAASLERVLADGDMAATLGNNARIAAETHFDWRIVGARVAAEVLARIDS